MIFGAARKDWYQEFGGGGGGGGAGKGLEPRIQHDAHK